MMQFLEISEKRAAFQGRSFFVRILELSYNEYTKCAIYSVLVYVYQNCPTMNIQRYNIVYVHQNCTTLNIQKCCPMVYVHQNCTTLNIQTCCPKVYVHQNCTTVKVHKNCTLYTLQTERAVNNNHLEGPEIPRQHLRSDKWS